MKKMILGACVALSVVHSGAYAMDYRGLLQNLGSRRNLALGAGLVSVPLAMYMYRKLQYAEAANFWSSYSGVISSGVDDISKEVNDLRYHPENITYADIVKQKRRLEYALNYKDFFRLNKYEISKIQGLMRDLDNLSGWLMWIKSWFWSLS